MITGECLSTVVIEEDPTDISTILQKENVIDVEIPVRGLLVKESIVVCNCSEQQIEAQSTNISHFCTGTFNYPLFIKLGNINKSLTCRLSDLLVYSGKLVLNDFRLMDQVWIDRQYERVQPKLPIFVSIVKNKHLTKANLFDLSQTGMCILADKTELEKNGKIMDSEMKILVNLPPNDSLCTIKGRVVQSRSISNNLLRIGLDISMPKRDAKTVAHYLSERRREILDELFLNFLDLMNYRDIKDEYF